MTIRKPSITIADKFLKLLNKKRGVQVGESIVKDHAPGGTLIAMKESFWRALFRPSKKELPSHMINLFDMDLDSPGRK